MPSSNFQQLQQFQKKVAALEAQLAREGRQLLKLPAKHGFSSMADFIAALKSASGGSTKSPSRAAKRRKRAVITPAIKEKVKALVGQGKTGSAIAKATGISLPSVQNIKKQLGLVKKRG